MDRTVPRGRAHTRISSLAIALMAVSLVAIPSCGGDSPTSPGEIRQTLSESLQTADITFHFSPGDRVDSAEQQAFHEWAVARLGVQMPARLQYYKYTGRTQMQVVTGRSTNGFAEPERYTVHSIWPHDGHEALHVYTALVGRPSDFFNEGIAVAWNIGPNPASIDPRWNGMHVHDHVAMLRRSGQFRSLSGMVATSDFRDVDDFVTYGEAGSFLLWLTDRYGTEPMLRFFRMSGRDDSRSRIEANLQVVWGISLEEAERRWLETIDARR